MSSMVFIRSFETHARWRVLDALLLLGPDMDVDSTTIFRSGRLTPDSAVLLYEDEMDQQHLITTLGGDFRSVMTERILSKKELPTVLASVNWRRMDVCEYVKKDANYRIFFYGIVIMGGGQMGHFDFVFDSEEEALAFIPPEGTVGEITKYN